MANYFRMIEDTEAHIEELHAHVINANIRKEAHLYPNGTENYGPIECEDGCDTCDDISADMNDLYASIDDLNSLVIMLKRCAFI